MENNNKELCEVSLTKINERWAYKIFPVRKKPGFWFRPKKRLFAEIEGEWVMSKTLNEYYRTKEQEENLDFNEKPDDPDPDTDK